MNDPLQAVLDRMFARAAKPPSGLAPDVDFPLHVFPPAIAAWLEWSADRARVRPSLVAIPFLAFTGAVIGRRLALEVAPGWIERPAIWVALVSPTGLGKTPALATARAPFLQLHQEAWQARLAAIEGRRRRLEPPRPAPPFDALFAASPSIAALSTALRHSSGLCILRDELYGLIRAMDRRRGEDRQYYLSLWSSEPILPAAPDQEIILDPVVSIVGGLQPGLLRKLHNPEQDGLLERFIFAFPTGRMDRWDEPAATASDPPGTTAVVDVLRALRRPTGKRPSTASATIPRAPEAIAAWSAWFDGNIDQHDVVSVHMSGFYRKLPSHLARLAIVLHALWNPADPAVPLSGDTMRHAIDLVEYLRVQIHRAGRLFGQHRSPYSAADALTIRVTRALENIVEDDGWIGRSRLLAMLGNPRLATFNGVIANMESVNVIETRKVRTGGPGRPSTDYRLHPRVRATLRPGL